MIDAASARPSGVPAARSKKGAASYSHSPFSSASPRAASSSAAPGEHGIHS